MKTTTKHFRTTRTWPRGAALATVAFLLLTGCASERKDTDIDNDDLQISGTATPTPTPGGSTSSCTNVQATLVAQNLVNGAVAVGANLLWQVNASGCASYALVRWNMAPLPFNGTAYFSTSYPLPVNGMIEVITVRAFDAAGNQVREITATSAPFNVTASGGSNPGPDPLTCSVGGPYNIDIPIDAYGNALVDPPIVTMPVTTNRASHLRRMTVLSGIAYVESGVPDYTSSGLHNPRVKFYGAGTNLVRFEVADATNSAIRTTCTGSVTLRGVYTPPAPCTLIANRYSVSPGGQVTFTLNSTGTIASARIDGVSVTPVNGVQRTIAFTTSRTVEASVTNQFGITSSCSASINVNQDVVGINYEDWSDWDYNDSVVCATGYLQVNGKQIVSHAFQSVLLRMSSRSACDHRVLVRVYDQWNNVRRSIHYTSAAWNGSSISVDLEPSWRIDSRFTPLGGCASTGVAEQATSARVVVGNYCNTAGN